jgi:hypothetical protein
MPQNNPIIRQRDYRILRMLRMAPFVRRQNGWRFGTKRIADSVIDRLVSAGRAVQDGNTVTTMSKANGALDRFALAPLPQRIAKPADPDAFNPLL